MKVEVLVEGLVDGGVVADALSPDNSAEGLEILVSGGEGYLHISIVGRPKSVRATMNDIFRSLHPILDEECVGRG